MEGQGTDLAYIGSDKRFPSRYRRLFRPARQAGGKLCNGGQIKLRPPRRRLPLIKTMPALHVAFLGREERNVFRQASPFTRARS